MENEIWVDLPSKPSFYQVSNKGRVYRKPYMKRVVNQYGETQIQQKGKILKQSKDSRGYLSITAMPERLTQRVHRMIAEAFLEPPSEDLVEICKKGGYDYVPINHIDRDKMNNTPSNLEWCTHAHNNNHSTEYGRESISGSSSSHSKLDEGDVDSVLKLRQQGWTQQKIADFYKVKQITISNILTGKSWSHYTGIKRSRRKYKQKTPYISEQVIKNY